MKALKPTIIRFSEPQTDFLKREAGRLGLAVAEVVRRLVDETREKREGNGAAEPSAATQVPSP